MPYGSRHPIWRPNFCKLVDRERDLAWARGRVFALCWRASFVSLLPKGCGNRCGACCGRVLGLWLAVLEAGSRLVASAEHLLTRLLALRDPHYPCVDHAREHLPSPAAILRRPGTRPCIAVWPVSLFCPTATSMAFKSGVNASYRGHAQRSVCRGAAAGLPTTHPPPLTDRRTPPTHAQPEGLWRAWTDLPRLERTNVPADQLRYRHEVMTQVINSY
eukprot:COSAG02_NODE_3207_length_7169_cov_2.626874_3_plen_217_part_00